MIAVGQNGTIYTYTVIHSAAEAFRDKTPYLIGLIEEGGRRSIALIEGYDGRQPIEIGMEVEVSRTSSDGHTIYRLLQRG